MIVHGIGVLLVCACREHSSIKPMNLMLANNFANITELFLIKYLAAPSSNVEKSETSIYTQPISPLELPVLCSIASYSQQSTCYVRD